MYRKLNRQLKKHTNDRPKSAGFTLTEVIVASTLMIIAIVPILKTLATAHASTKSIETKTQSLTLAQAKLNEIKARSLYSYDSSYTENDLSLDGPYLCDVKDDSADPLRTITVSVGYDQNNNNALSAGEIEVTLSTLIARRWAE